MSASGKSKIEQRQKSRESRSLDVSIAATCDGAVTKVPGRFLRSDVVPHVARRGKHQQLLKFSFIPPKRLLQQNLPKAEVVGLLIQLLRRRGRATRAAR